MLAAHQPFRVYPGAFGMMIDSGIHAMQNARFTPQDVVYDPQALREQLDLQAREIHRLQGTASHYRAWAAQLQARYQMFSPDAARPAKRVYIGNLPADMSEPELRAAINEMMYQMAGTLGEGPCVTSCKLYAGTMGSGSAGGGGGRTASVSVGTVESSRSASPERMHGTNANASNVHAGDGSAQTPPTPSTARGGGGGGGISHNHSHNYPPVAIDKAYAFVEFRSVEEASNAMALDGVRFRDAFLKVRRPSNYDPAVAIMLGPVDPSPALDLSSFDVVRTVVQDSPHKVFIGGLPCDWTEDQVKEMLLPFGPLRAFNLVMDRATGNSRGYAFCEFLDVNVTESAIQSLHGKPVGNKYMTVKRALGPPPY